VTFNYIINRDNLQYITELELLPLNRYILGTINQKTLGLTIRADLNLTPEFSIQYYGSPFISRGSYSRIKYITDPKAKLFEDRFDDYTGPLSSNPDFNFHEFRSNLVAKWEYRLGSFIYLVWSSERSGTTTDSHISAGESYKQLRSIFPNNIFLIKLNYWFSL
jgi:hypothetical protein